MFWRSWLEAAREVTDKPVIGIAQAAFAVATAIAPNFSIVYVLDHSEGIIKNVVQLHGVEKFCRSCRSAGMGVLDFERDPLAGLQALELQSRKCMEEDKAECIVLGCAGFVQFVSKLNKEFPIPVIDGVSPAVKLCEALVDMGCKLSKKAAWAYPEPKPILGFQEIKKF